jgi:hypothetical protein
MVIIVIVIAIDVEAGESYVRRSFITCTFHKIVGLSNQGG